MNRTTSLATPRARPYAWRRFGVFVGGKGFCMRATWTLDSMRRYDEICYEFPRVTEV